MPGDDDLSKYEVKDGGDDLSKYEVKDEGPSFNQQLTELRPWPKFDTSHPVASAANEIGTGLGNIGAGAISAVESVPSMLEHPIQSIEGIPQGLIQMGKTALSGHPEYALGQMIPGMAAGELASGVKGLRSTGESVRNAADVHGGTLRNIAADAAQKHVGQTLANMLRPSEPKPFAGTTAPVVDQAGIPRIGNEAPAVQMVPPRMRTLPKVAAPTPFGGVEAPTPQAGIPKISGGTPAATSSGPQALRFMGPGETPTAPEPARIVQPGSVPPDVKVTYQSVPGEELARKAQKGDLDAIRELRRRGGQDLPPNSKYLIEPGAVNKPWRNLER
jgi:hypothetical protein